MSVFARTFWTGPDELVFLATTGEYVWDGELRKPVLHVTSWDVRTNAIARHAPADVGLCYDRGRIAYRENEHLTKRVWTSLGHHPGPIVREEREIRYDEQMSCMPLEALPPVPSRDAGHEFVRLLPEHGFIDFGPARTSLYNTPVLHVPGSVSGIELPFPRREIERGTISYFPFKGAYFIQSRYFDVARGEATPWPAELPRPIWWLYPDGKVERVLLPPAEWMRGRIFPTRSGLLVVYNNPPIGPGKEESYGIFLIDGAHGQRLSRGVFLGGAVSPGGCRFASPRVRNPGPQHQWILTVFELCEEPR